MYKTARFWYASPMSTNVLTTVFLMLILAMSVSAVGTISTTTYATTGMGNCRDEPEGSDCVPQKDRVGNDDPDDNDADRDGPGGAGGSEGDPGQGNTGDPSDEGESNCWGKVASALAHNDDGKPGLGEHSSDPVPGDDDNETPREGVGNQREGHPSDHADTVGGLADDVPDCVD